MPTEVLVRKYLCDYCSSLHDTRLECAMHECAHSAEQRRVVGERIVDGQSVIRHADETGPLDGCVDADVDSNTTSLLGASSYSIDDATLLTNDIATTNQSVKTRKSRHEHVPRASSNTNVECHFVPSPSSAQVGSEEAYGQT
ncbi:unnamed protein product [Sphagnum balticum]